MGASLLALAKSIYYFDDVFGKFFTVIDRGFLSPTPVYCLYGLDLLLFTYEKHIFIQVMNRQK